MTEPTPFYSRPGLNVDTFDARVERAGTAIEGDVDFYLRLAQTLGGPVLELGAGSGRVTYAIAKAGLEVFGVESSAALLARAEQTAAGLDEEVRARAHLVQASLPTFDLHRTFPLTIIPCRSFQLLTTPEEQRKALLAIRRHLNPGGRLVVHNFDPRLDWCAPEGAPGSIDHGTVRRGEGSSVRAEVVRRDNDPAEQLMRELWRFTETNAAGDVLGQEEELLTMRWTYRQEMRYLLELSGFVVESEFSDFKESPPGYGREQIWVARRSVPSPGRG